MKSRNCPTDLLPEAFLNVEYRLVEGKKTHQVVKETKEQFQVLLLTARSPGKAKKAHPKSSQDILFDTLTELELEFSSSFPFETLEMKGEGASVIFQPSHPFEEPGKPLFYRNLIFTNFLDKGTITGEFLLTLKSLGHAVPEIIILIDDNRANLESVKKYCESTGIVFIGFHYQHVKLTAQPLNEELVAIQKQFLLFSKKIISDKSAQIKMELKSKFTF